ncbi:unnamed protein product, partial [Polarella glacialis]
MDRPFSADRRDEALFRRAGMTVLESNADYGNRSQEEAAAAETELEELRRMVRLRACRCEGQLDALARQAMAAEEQRVISERVSHEMDAFREEMRLKEEAENERIRHLYRGLLGPGSQARETW